MIQNERGGSQNGTRRTAAAGADCPRTQPAATGGEKITRNMLSQIENGSATPSVDTLRYLAQQLHKPVSFFLEGGSSLPGFEKVWEAFRAGDAQQALNQLDALPEEANGWEYALLRALALLSAAEQYIQQGRGMYAGKLLTQAEALEEKLSFLPELKTRRLLLRAKLKLPVEAEALQSLDEQLYLHAYAALGADAPVRAAAYLDACADRTGADWHLLRAKVYMKQGEYAAAAVLLQQEEKKKPEETGSAAGNLLPGDGRLPARLLLRLLAAKIVFYTPQIAAEAKSIS